MKATREELIDFMDWYYEQPPEICFSRSSEIVDNYLKSINSEAGNETPTVTDNEAKKEVCQHCNGSKEVEFREMYGRIISIKRCPYC